MDWKYAIRGPSGIISLAETYEEAEKAIDTLVETYGISLDDLDIIDLEDLT